MDIVYWSVPSSSRTGDGVKEVDGKYRYFSRLRVSLLDYIHNNLVLDQSNNKSIEKKLYLNSRKSKIRLKNYAYCIWIYLSSRENPLKCYTYI